MKKMILFAFTCLTLASCGNSQNQDDDKDPRRYGMEQKEDCGCKQDCGCRPRQD